MKEKKVLVIVDMQNDFINGSLGTEQAKAIVPRVVEKINSWDGEFLYTKDTHGDKYLNTREGKYLPVKHCIINTKGHDLDSSVMEALNNKKKEGAFISGIWKDTFGSRELPEKIRIGDYKYVEFVGLCTDICVISNCLLVKASFPELDIAVDGSCCAGVTPEKHEAALEVMKSCQIDVN